MGQGTAGETDEMSSWNLRITPSTPSAPPWAETYSWTSSMNGAAGIPRGLVSGAVTGAVTELGPPAVGGGAIEDDAIVGGMERMRMEGYGIGWWDWRSEVEAEAEKRAELVPWVNWAISGRSGGGIDCRCGRKKENNETRVPIRGTVSRKEKGRIRKNKSRMRSDDSDLDFDFDVEKKCLTGDWSCDRRQKVDK